MEKKHSLVYLDDVVQRYLKDILIPILGYRDTSVTLGSYSSRLDKLDHDVNELQIPDKSKFYNHASMDTPIFIALPENSYANPDSPMNEDVIVMIDMERTIIDYTTSAEKKRNYSFSVVIPGNSDVRDKTYKAPYCAYCNKSAYEDMKSFFISYLIKDSKAQPRVLCIEFPDITEKNISEFHDCHYTIYSENRNVEKGDWTTQDMKDPVTQKLTSWTVTMGSVPYFDPVEKQNELVYSKNVRHIETLTLPTLEYLQETGKTDPSTLYVGREDDDGMYQGKVTFSSVEDFKRELPTIFKVFGYNLGNLDIEFTDAVTNIDGLFEGNKDIQGTPRSIGGRNIENARRLFMNSSVKTITTPSTLFQNMPNLLRLDSAFEGTEVRTPITYSLITSAPKLVSVRRMFANSKVRTTESLWYTPDGFYDGLNCFLNCPLDSTSAEDMLSYWNDATDVYDIEFLNKTHFDRLRDEIIFNMNGDLSKYNMTVTSIGKLDSLFESSGVIKSPNSLISEDAPSAINMFRNTLVESVSPGLVAQLKGLKNASGMLADNPHLTAFPENFVLPKSIDNYTDTFANLINITGPTPKSGGYNLWTLAGQSGYPDTIIGKNCFGKSPFSNRNEIPVEWGGEANA